MRLLTRLLAATCAFGTEATVGAQDEAQAQDWPRFHIGFAFAETQLGLDMTSVGIPEQPWGNSSLGSDTRNKVVFGFRPHRIVGVELQSIDFGGGAIAAHAGRQLSSGQVTYWEVNSYMQASSEAKMLSALLFIPEPSAWLDVYGKVGVAEVDDSFWAYAFHFLPPECTPRPSTIGPPYPPSCSFRTDLDQTDENLYVDRTYSTPYVGIGIRFRVARQLAVRVEYETIDQEIGENRTMWSLGFAWEPPSLRRRRPRP